MADCSGCNLRASIVPNPPNTWIDINSSQQAGFTGYWWIPNPAGKHELDYVLAIEGDGGSCEEEFCNPENNCTAKPRIICTANSPMQIQVHIGSLAHGFSMTGPFPELRTEHFDAEEIPCGQRLDIKVYCAPIPGTVHLDSPNMAVTVECQDCVVEKS